MKRVLQLPADLFWFVCGLVWASWQRLCGRIDYRGGRFCRDVWRLVRSARGAASLINVIPPGEA